MRINASGFVLVGTATAASSASALTLYRDAADTELFIQNSTTGTGSNGFRILATGNNVFLTNKEAGYIAVETSDTERMRITAGGNVLIGTTTESPGGRLTVVTGSDEAVWTRISAGAAAANMISWNDANSGNNYFHGFNINSTGDAIGSIDYNRGAGLVRYNTTSDATLKNILGDSDGQRSLDILNTTRIREFAWKSDVNQKTQIGVIAQELHETFAGAVMVGGEQKDGKYRPWGVDKTAFTFHLIAGWQVHEKIIQEQQAIITQLQADVAALKGAK
jgi:hypothetical protein